MSLSKIIDCGDVSFCAFVQVRKNIQRPMKKIFLGITKKIRRYRQVKVGLFFITRCPAVSKMLLGALSCFTIVRIFAIQSMVSNTASPKNHAYYYKKT